MMWLPIKDYEGLYLVSNDGEIKSLCREVKGTLGGSFFTNERILSQPVVNGYKKVLLYKKGNRKMLSVHRIVATSFLSNNNHLPQVNHINGVKSDNRASNLEWVTAKENVAHAHASGLVKKRLMSVYSKNKLSKSKMKKVINTATGKVYNCITDAAKDHGVSLSQMSQMLSGVLINKTTLRKVA